MTRSLHGAPVLALLLWGCNHDAGSGVDAATSPTPEVAQVGIPDTKAATSLKLVNGDQTLSLKDPLDRVFQVFGRPKPSFEFNDLPPGFQPPYAAKGWETAREGMGAILYGDQVVAVMRQISRTTPELFQSTLDAIRNENSDLKPNIVQGSRVTYYFWEAPPQRIMVCALSTKRDGWHVTEVLGDDTVLDVLGVSPSDARANQPKVDHLLDAVKG
jgi:hypothetical protein